MSTEYVTHDSEALRFMHSKFPNSEKQIGSDRYLTACPSCGAKKKFWWSTDKMPYNAGCFACGYKTHVFDLGYRTEKKTRQFSDLSSIESLVLAYHNKSGKRHRLSQRVIDEFGIQAIKFNKKSGVGQYYALAIPDNTAMGCTKKLNVEGRWISVERKYRNNRVWLNAERIKPTDEFVFVLAGEWDMFAFWEHTGMHGISPVDGEGTAGKLPKNAYDIFSNKKVVILFDNDKAGRSGSRSLVSAIQKRVKTKWIRCPDLSRLGLMGGQDIDDFFAGGNSKDRLREEIEATPDFTHVLTEDEIELARIPDAFERPESPDSVLEPDVLNKIWKTLLLPEAKRNAIFAEIAESEGYSQDEELKMFNARLKVYKQELGTLRYTAYDKLINEWFSRYHVKQSIRQSEMSEALYYYYDEGYYQFLSDDMLAASADEIAKKLTSPDARMELSRTRKQALEDIRHKLLEAPETDFDHHKHYINFENGTYILKTRELVAHSHKFLTNYKLPIVFDPGAKCPNFKEALNDWTLNEEDARELLKGLYYLISGDRSKSVVFWLQGDGNDGKGEFTHLCKSLIGDKRTSALAIETIEKTHYTAELYNKMLNIADEVPSNYILPDAIFKRISGNSVLTGDPKYKGLFTFISRALWVIPSNHMPNVADTSRGYFRRFKIFQFKRIPKEKEIGDFFQTKLKPELSGIVNHILTEGRDLFEKEGFVKTASENESMDEMKEKNTAFLYWQNVFALWEEKIKETIEQTKLKEIDPDMSDADIRRDAIVRNLRRPSDFGDTLELDVLQLYEKKTGEKIVVVNPKKHYEYYKDFYKGDEVKFMSLSKFRKSTQNFYKDYFPDKRIEKIRVWKKELGGAKSEYFLAVL